MLHFLASLRVPTLLVELDILSRAIEDSLHSCQRSLTVSKSSLDG